MKKLSMVMIGFFVLSALVFAGGASQNSKSAGETVTLTFMGWPGNDVETEFIQKGVSLYEEKYPNVKVQWTPTGAGEIYTAKVMSAVASNDPPDVFYADPGDYRGYVKRGLLLDITDRFNKDFPVEDYIPLARTIQTVNGRVYGLNACMVCPLVLYNKDVFDAAGEPYPSTTKIWTIDEFRAVAKRLTRGDTWGVYGLDSRLMLEAFFSSAGGAVYNADYSQSTFNNPQVKRVLETIKAIREVDKTMPYSSTLENAGINTYQMLQTGKVAMLIDGSWSVMRLGQDLKLGIAPLPSFGKPLTVGQAHMHSIARNGRHPDESWEFIKFLADVKGYSGLLLREGLWLPNRFSQWADGPNGIDAWYNAGRYGNYYREMRDYLMAALVQPDAMVYTGEQNDIQSEELSLYFNDNKAIDKVLSDTQSRINDVIAQMK